MRNAKIHIIDHSAKKLPIAFSIPQNWFLRSFNPSQHGQLSGLTHMHPGIHQSLYGLRPRINCGIISCWNSSTVYKSYMFYGETSLH